MRLDRAEHLAGGARIPGAGEQAGVPQQRVAQLAGLGRAELQGPVQVPAGRLELACLHQDGSEVVMLHRERALVAGGLIGGEQLLVQRHRCGVVALRPGELSAQVQRGPPEIIGADRAGVLFGGERVGDPPG